MNKQRLRTDQAGQAWIMSSLRQPFVSGVVDRSRLVMRVCTRSHAIFFTFCYELYSNLATLMAAVKVE